MKKLLISSLAVAVISSCVSNDNPADHRDEGKKNNNTNAAFRLLKKATEIKQTGTPYVLEFKYNGDKITESYNAADDDKIIYTYNGDYIIKMEEFVGGVLVLMKEFTYSNGKLATEKVTDKEQGILVYTKNYQYVSNTHVKFNEYKDATYNASTGTYSNLQFAQADAYLTNNGNVASVSYIYNGTTYNITNMFDTSNNPMRSVKGFIELALTDVHDGQLSYNNLLTQKEIYSGAVNGSNKITATHTLGGDNYPTKTVTTYDISSYGTTTITSLYEYY
ncbi:hypothetical protein [Chryseobacterium sp.]|uniref:hypothetical protein n=1 Tax=Chryseobacterium sp. TaxID=1871047 RepID=UPI0025B9DB58|nr:hypothetical protein [Chryseobacterium sp.]MBV8326898.1 hypothetical protein [Chryseobacterium sp.]